jgi:DNA-binding transcriptional LysR family regulator
MEIKSKRMIRLDDLEIFLKAASQESFSAAARKLDVGPAQVSAAIKRLERELEIRLFTRSTRSMRLTAEGERYLPFAREAMDNLLAGRESTRMDLTQVQRTLQIACASDLGRNVLLPWLLEYRRANPNVNFRLSVSDRVADVFSEPVDIAIRYGNLSDANYVCLPLVPHNRRVIAAAPTYISRHGAPQNPSELAEHACLQYELNGKVYDKWRFPTLTGHMTVAVKGPVISDDADIVRRCAIAGEGIIYKSWLDIRSDVESGALVVLCPDHPGERFPLSFICPHRKQFSFAIRQLYGWLMGRCLELAAGLPSASAYQGLPELAETSLRLGQYCIPAATHTKD